MTAATVVAVSRLLKLKLNNNNIRDDVTSDESRSVKIRDVVRILLNAAGAAAAAAVSKPKRKLNLKFDFKFGSQPDDEKENL